MVNNQYLYYIMLYCSILYYNFELTVHILETACSSHTLLLLIYSCLDFSYTDFFVNILERTDKRNLLNGIWNFLHVRNMINYFDGGNDYLTFLGDGIYCYKRHILNCIRLTFTIFSSVCFSLNMAVNKIFFIFDFFLTLFSIFFSFHFHG